MRTEYLDWKYLPDLILEQIFVYLANRDRLAASCTCIPWNQTFYSPRLWKTFIYIPPAYLESCSHQIYYDIASYNLSSCFRNIGYCFQTIVIPPISDYLILNRSLNVIADFYHKQNKTFDSLEEIDPLFDYRSKLEHFSFEFDSQIVNRSTYGTGGVLLASIRKLLDILSNLKSARLKSLLLTPNDRLGLFDEFVKHNCLSIVRLSLVDISKASMPVFGIRNFLNLVELELSCFEICSDLLITVIQDTKLELLILTQTRFSLFSEEFASIEPIPGYVWQLVIDLNPMLKVHQRHTFNNISEFIDLNSITIVYQPKPAPITRYSFISNNFSLLDLNKLEQYSQTLTEIIIIIDSATDSGIRSSIDEELLWVVTLSSNVNSLILGGERLSICSSTILYILLEVPQKIKQLIIQNNIIQYRIESIIMDMFHSSLPNDLISSSSDPHLFRLAVSAHLKVPKWNLLTEEQFFRIVYNHKYLD